MRRLALFFAFLAPLALPLLSVPGASFAAGSDAGIGKAPPDPAPLRERIQYVFDLRYVRGDVFLVGVRETDMGSPMTTPRAFGRFALELYDGPALVERVRFDFPLLGAGVGMGGDGGTDFGAKLSTRIGVFFPKTTKGTRLELVDRARDRRFPLAWPPVLGEASAAQVRDAAAD